MALPVNAAIQDALTTRGVIIQRVVAWKQREIVRALKKLEARLIEALMGRDPNAVARTSYQAARLKSLLAQTRSIIRDGFSRINEMHYQGLVDVGRIEIANFMALANAAIGADLVTVALPARTLQSIASNVLIEGAPSKTWWSRQASGLQQRFADRVRVGMLKGETTDKIVQGIRGSRASGFTDGVMSATTRNAEALVRTSVQTVANEARTKLYEENQDVVKGVQWVATLDDRTTEICQELHGKAWSLPDYKPIGHDLPFPGPTAHWNCRSTQVAVFRSWKELSKGRSVRTKDGGKSDVDTIYRRNLKELGFNEEQIQRSVYNARASMDGQVPRALSFDDWVKTKPAEVQNKIFGKRSARLWREGKLTKKEIVASKSRPMSPRDYAKEPPALQAPE